MTTGYDRRDPGPQSVPHRSLSGRRSSLQLCLSRPWFILHGGQAGVTGGGARLKGRAVRHTGSSTGASALLILVGSPSRAEQNLSGSLGPCPPTCHSSLSPLTPGEKGWQKLCPLGEQVWPQGGFTSKGTVCMVTPGHGDHMHLPRPKATFPLTCEPALLHLNR